MMLQKITQKKNQETSNRNNKKGSSTPPKTGSMRRHILNIDFQNNKTYDEFEHHKTLDPMFKTFLNRGNLSWRTSHAKRQHHSVRKAGNSQQQSINSTHFTSTKLNERNLIVPYMDHQHYQSLLRAIFGLKHGRPIAEIKQKVAKNKQQFNSSPNYQGKKQNRYKLSQIMSESLNCGSQSKNYDISSPTASPRVVNISAELNRKQNRQHGQPKDNLYQNIFKNKRKLHDKHFQERNSNDTLDIKILGEDELQIHQVVWGRRGSRHRKAM